MAQAEKGVHGRERCIVNEVLRQEKKYAIDLAEGAALRSRLGRVM